VCWEVCCIVVVWWLPLCVCGTELRISEADEILNDSQSCLSKMPAGCRNLLDEVYPGIFVGDRHAAQKTEFLKRLGITHILNAAQGTRARTVNTGKAYYSNSNIEYLGLELLDNETEMITQHLTPALQFICKAVDQGKVLVHCEMGISRSSTFVIAYLMWKEKMNLIEAVKKVREKRDVRPNSGFLKQLVLLEMNLANLPSGACLTTSNNPGCLYI